MQNRITIHFFAFFFLLVDEYRLDTRNYSVSKIILFSRLLFIISMRRFPIRYNRLLNTIHASLQELLKAMKGLVVLSQALEEMSKSLYNNTVPIIWSKVVCEDIFLLFFF